MFWHMLSLLWGLLQWKVWTACNSRTKKRSKKLQFLENKYVQINVSAALTWTFGSAIEFDSYFQLNSTCGDPKWVKVLYFICRAVFTWWYQQWNIKKAEIFIVYWAFLHCREKRQRGYCPRFFVRCRKSSRSLCSSLLPD